MKKTHTKYYKNTKYNTLLISAYKFNKHHLVIGEQPLIYCDIVMKNPVWKKIDIQENIITEDVLHRQGWSPIAKEQIILELLYV